MRKWTGIIACMFAAALLLAGTVFADEDDARLFEYLPAQEVEDTAPEQTVPTAGKYTVTYIMPDGTKQREKVNEGELPAKMPTTDSSGNAISGWKNENGIFVKPAEQAAISDMSYTAVLAPTLVKEQHVLYMQGSSEYFRPAATLTRAESAQLLSKIVQFTDDSRGVFYDVPANAWYYNAVSRLSGSGVIGGYADGTFRPDAPITRAEFVTIVVGLFPVKTCTASYYDVPESHWAYNAIAAASASGWVKGFPDGTFRPDAPVTRAEAAAIVNKILGRSADKQVLANEVIFSFYDLSPNAWYYGDVLEASLEHSYDCSNGQETWTDYKISVGTLTPGQYFYGQDMYYIGQDGRPVKSTTINGFTYDANGRYTSGNAELDGYVKAALAKCTNTSMTQMQKLRAAYVYTRDSFSYLKRDYYSIGYKGWEMKNALIMLQTHKGNCYCYASVFYYLSRQLGFNATAISGVVGTNSSPHGWVEMTFNGTVNIFDTELEMAYKVKGVTYNFYMMPYAKVPWPYRK